MQKFKRSLAVAALLLALSGCVASADCGGTEGSVMLARPPRNGRQSVFVVPYNCSPIVGGTWVRPFITHHRWYMGDNVRFVRDAEGRIASIW